MAAERKMRRAQTISPSGVGAIIDIVGESFVAEDIGRWRGREVLPAPRIAARFNVDELRTPPAKGKGIPFYRFPRWLFCGRCRTMTFWSPGMEKPGQAPRCEKCPGRPSQLFPMRFIAVCGNGHLDDIDWWRWAHSDPRDREQRQCGNRGLTFRHVPRVGGGLESLEVRCGKCDAARDLHELPLIGSLARVGQRCPGRQPWQTRPEAQDCEEQLVALQRGASSVYFSEVISAIDLPPESNWSSWGGPEGRIEHNDNFKLLLSHPDHLLRDQLVGMIANEEDVTAADVRRVLSQKLGIFAAAEDSGMGVGDLPREEWLALTEPPETYDPRDSFIARRTPFRSAQGHGPLEPMMTVLEPLVGDIVLVDRLREVRVLRSFRRHTMKRAVPVDLSGRADFLPAIEIFGEGVFIRFDEQRLAEWSGEARVARRCKLLSDRLAGSFRARWLTEEVTPRLVLLHTFAHMLIRQMSFSAGYSSSSLRERLYAAEPSDEPGMAGILIYTAAGDSEGTLGGLARLGEAERLVPMLAGTLASAQWCSLDPVCREATAQGPEGLSLAACHACVLVSETSCVMGNVLLDRMLVLDEDFGFFRDPLSALLQARLLT